MYATCNVPHIEYAYLSILFRCTIVALLFLLRLSSFFPPFSTSFESQILTNIRPETTLKVDIYGAHWTVYRLWDVTKWNECLNVKRRGFLLISCFAARYRPTRSDLRLETKTEKHGQNTKINCKLICRPSQLTQQTVAICEAHLYIDRWIGAVVVYTLATFVYYCLVDILVFHSMPNHWIKVSNLSHYSQINWPPTNSRRLTANRWSN